MGESAPLTDDSISRDPRPPVIVVRSYASPGSRSAGPACGSRREARARVEGSLGLSLSNVTLAVARPVPSDKSVTSYSIVRLT